MFFCPNHPKIPRTPPEASSRVRFSLRCKWIFITWRLCTTNTEYTHTNTHTHPAIKSDAKIPGQAVCSQWTTCNGKWLFQNWQLDPLFCPDEILNCLHHFTSAHAYQEKSLPVWKWVCVYRAAKRESPLLTDMKIKSIHSYLFSFKHALKFKRASEVIWGNTRNDWSSWAVNMLELVIHRSFIFYFLCTVLFAPPWHFLSFNCSF